MKITISELRQIIIEEVEHEAQLEETLSPEIFNDQLGAIKSQFQRGAITRTKAEALLKKLSRQRGPGFGEFSTSDLNRLFNQWSPMEESLNEELTKTDKAEIKRMISKELDSSLQKELKKALEEELTKALKSKDVKTDIGEISKKVLKKLYKDLSLHHPYIIDRIKV
jgi:uncharacterized membrane protein YheB (UPF0754 family)